MDEMIFKTECFIDCVILYDFNEDFADIAFRNFIKDVVVWEERSPLDPSFVDGYWSVFDRALSIIKGGMQDESYAAQAASLLDLVSAFVTRHTWPLV